ncbi:Fur family transcriptional regulator [Pseudoclavibacter sp. RFBA6]|uniref:Fur family transcriptional regulator n=1 Tax=Pseudoclavibacter sp. RFBA6 TaxID=2080573 RepID=UPI000CE77FBA|nr:Fur family transcriptional regulator [Pseudoclavibacter sp. RFBA6]PPG38862.1 transcriptional repressor [Pseudoclavibacter sp. RFBA6]
MTMSAEHDVGKRRDAAFWRSALRDAGLRVTRQRVTVLELLDADPHASAERIFAAATSLRAELGSLTLQAVYGILDDLGRTGLVRRFDAPRTAARFETRIGDNHHHAVCDECGRIEDIDCSVGEAPCLVPDAPNGFAVHTAEVVYRGVCADCAPR